jgi:hypothetical protein
LFLPKFNLLSLGIYPKDLKSKAGLAIVEVEANKFEERFNSSSDLNSERSSGKVTKLLP